MFVNVENLKITVGQKEEKNKSTFYFEPLPTGFGATLGNSLRRVLLTSIKGAAVTQVKINGANHQFTTIEGVKEDIVEVTLNLKKLRFNLHGDSPVIVTISKKGGGKVTGADIELTSDVEIMNPKQQIATLAKANTEFKAELTIEPGVGYSPMEERQTSKIGVITLDALYSPIVSAVYEVEPTRFGERADLDKLILTIETDGSITPAKSLKDAGVILKDYYEKIILGETKVEKPSEGAETGLEKSRRHTEDVEIDELPLQTRTINALKKHGVKTLQELAKMPDEEIADVKNLGEKSLNEIKDLLVSEGLR